LNEEESPVVSSHNDEEYYDYNHETNSKGNSIHEPAKKASDGNIFFFLNVKKGLIRFLIISK